MVRRGRSAKGVIYSSRQGDPEKHGMVTIVG
jgi:hypothetical protein